MCLMGGLLRSWFFSQRNHLGFRMNDHVQDNRPDSNAFPDLDGHHRRIHIRIRKYPP